MLRRRSVRRRRIDLASGREFLGPAPMQKIAFWRSIGDAYVFGQPLRLLRIGGVWLAIFFLYSLWYVLPGAVARPTGLADALRDSGIELAALLFYLFGLISFAV